LVEVRRLGGVCALSALNTAAWLKRVNQLAVRVYYTITTDDVKSNSL